MAKILVVDDNLTLTQVVEQVLRAEGHRVGAYHAAADVLKALKAERPDLLILDIAMPEMDGVELCAKIRNNALMASIPIIFLTAKGAIEDKTQGFEAGGDDYLTKPFQNAELVLRVRALLRRTAYRLPSSPNDLLQVGDLVLDQRNYRAYVEEQHVLLTPLEFELLKFFMLHPGKVFSAEELMHQIWDFPTRGNDASLVRKHIKNLRDKLETPTHSHRYIRTVSRHGYVFSSDGV